MLQHSTNQNYTHHQSQLLNSPYPPSNHHPSLWVMSKDMEVESQLIRPATHVGHIGDCCTPQIFQQLNGLRQTTHQMTGVLAFWHAWSLQTHNKWHVIESHGKNNLWFLIKNVENQNKKQTCPGFKTWWSPLSGQFSWLIDCHLFWPRVKALKKVQRKSLNGVGYEKTHHTILRRLVQVAQKWSPWAVHRKNNLHLPI